MKDDNILLADRPHPAGMAESVAHEPALVAGKFTLGGTQHSILLSQPFFPYLPAEKMSPYDSEFVSTILCGLSSGVSSRLRGRVSSVNLTEVVPALWDDKLKPAGDIGDCASRAPENIVRAECGTPIDVWALGCMVSRNALSSL